MLNSGEYQRKYGVTRAWICRLVKEKRHGGYYDNGVWYIEDAPVADRKPTGGNWKRCGMCGVIKNRTKHFSASRRDGAGVCRECSAHLERQRRGATRTAEHISYALELAAVKQLQATLPSMMPHREAAIQRAMARVAADGYAGDGTDFKD